MKQYFFLFFISVLLCSSMAIASITPSSISFSAYPGETVRKNLTINNDYTGLLNLSYAPNNTEVEVSFNSPIFVERAINKQVEIIFTLPVDAKIEAYYFNFSTVLLLDESYKVVDHYSGGGGGGGGGGSATNWYWNGSTWSLFQNNATHVDTIIDILNVTYINKTIVTEINNTINITVEQKEVPIEIAYNSIKKWSADFWRWLDNTWKIFKFWS